MGSSASQATVVPTITEDRRDDLSNDEDVEDDVAMDIDEEFLPYNERLQNPYRKRRLHPILMWEQPEPETFPVSIREDSHCSVTAVDCKGRSVDGLFYFDPPPGTSLSAGVHTITVTFIPKNSYKYCNSSTTCDLVVKKRRPEVVWNPPIADRWFVYRHPLPKSLFEGISSELPGGRFECSHKAGLFLEIGKHSLSVEFTPDENDWKNYSRGYATLVINVAGAAVPLVWVYEGHDKEIVPYSGKRRRADIGAVGKEIVYGDPLPGWLFTARCEYEDVEGEWVYTPPQGTVLPAHGYHDLRAVFNPRDLERYKTSIVTQRVFVHRAPSVVEWPTPPSIPEGEVLDDYVLRASCVEPKNLPGTFVYTPPAGTGLPQGVHKLHVKFIPDNSSFSPSECTTTLKMMPKRSLRIMWMEPDVISYPTPLSRYQLNAALVGSGSHAQGVFEYDPPLDTVLDAGKHVLKVRFYPVKPSLAMAEASTTLTVQPSPARLVWSQPDAIMEGEGLYDTVLNCFATNVPKADGGEYIYEPGFGTVLPGGDHRLSCRFRPKNANNFLESRISVIVSVRPRPRFMPRLQWSDPVPESPVIFGTPLDVMHLSASCTNSLGYFEYDTPLETVLPVGTFPLCATFVPLDPTKCIEGIKISSQITVLQRRPNFEWNPTSLDIVFGTRLNASDHLNATVTYAVGDVSKVEGRIVYKPELGTLLETGEYRITCSFFPTDSHNFTEVHDAKMFFVQRAFPVVQWVAPSRPLRQPVSFGSLIFPKPVLAGSTGDPQAVIAGYFSYEFSVHEAFAVGLQKFRCRYIPEDIINFFSGSAEIEVEVIPADAALSPSSPGKIPTTSLSTTIPAQTETSIKHSGED